MLAMSYAENMHSCKNFFDDLKTLFSPVLCLVSSHNFSLSMHHKLSPFIPMICSNDTLMTREVLAVIETDLPTIDKQDV